jgi:hypothetical protein
MTTHALSDRLKATFAAATAALTFAMTPAAAQTQPVYAPADAAAAQIKHPLIMNDRAIVRYRTSLSMELAKATGDDMARAAVSHFNKVLEARLNGPNLARPQSVRSERISPSTYVLSGVIPPASMYQTEPIAVCAEKDGKVVATFLIDKDGSVRPDTQRGPNGTDPANAFQYACRPHVVATGKAYMNTASPTPAAPEPRAAAPASR